MEKRKEANFFDRLDVLIDNYPYGCLGAVDFVVMTMLLRKANRYGDDLIVMTSNLAEECKVTPNTLIASRKRLQDIGFLKVEAGKVNQKSPRYIINAEFFNELYQNKTFGNCNNYKQTTNKLQLNYKQTTNKVQTNYNQTTNKLQHNNIYNKESLSSNNELLIKGEKNQNEDIPKNESSEFENFENSHINETTSKKRKVAPKEKDPEFIAFEAWIKENAPSVARMKEPFSEEQWRELLKTYDLPMVQDMLQRMDNWTKLGNNKSAYRTILNWLNRDKNGTRTENGNRGGYTQQNSICEYDKNIDPKYVKEYKTANLPFRHIAKTPVYDHELDF